YALMVAIRAVLADAVRVQAAQAVGQRCVVGHHHARIAERAQVLGGIEGEGRRVPADADRLPVLPRADSLRSVHDQAEIIAVGDLREGVTVGHLAEEVYRQETFRARRDLRLDLRRVQVERADINIHVDGTRPDQRDGFGRRAEGERGGDDLIAGADAARHQRQHQRVRAGGDSQTILCAADGGDLLLKTLHVGPVNEAAAFDDAHDGRVYLLLEFVILRSQVREWNFQPFLPMAYAGLLSENAPSLLSPYYTPTPTPNASLLCSGWENIRPCGTLFIQY